jgi:hypothetical protein
MDMTQALHIAERLHRDFAAMRLPGLEVHATVSVGVAMANESGRNLPALLALADRVLYRAKADGRNRVAPAPLVLVDRNGGETSRRAMERSAAMAAPRGRVTPKSLQCRWTALCRARCQCAAFKPAAAVPSL